MVIVVVMFLKEDVAHLEEVVVPMVVDRSLIIRGPGSVSIAREITTSLRSEGRSLVTLNGHSWLMLILLLLVILPMFVLPQLLTVLLAL